MSQHTLSPSQDCPSFADCQDQPVNEASNNRQMNLQPVLLETDLSVIAADIRPLQNCEDDPNYSAIFDAVPSFWRTSEMEGFLCWLSPEDRAALMTDVEEHLNEIWSLSQEDFDGYMQQAEDFIRSDMQGGYSYQTHFNHLMLGLWQECVSRQ